MILPRAPRPNLPLLLLLAAGLAHGLLYVFLVPPWQHYDEPTHFEYAWLVANRPGLPAPGDYDQGMRRQVAVSMLENAFFFGMDFRPDLNATTEPIWIGISETHHPPLYYLLASLPLRLASGADLAVQLRLARLVSLLLFLCTIAAAWSATGLVTAPDSPLRVLVPASVALLPGLADLMTAVNNDVAAVAAMSLCFWVCLRLVVRPFRWTTLALAAVFALAGVASKGTALMAAPMVALAAVLGLMRGRWRPVFWAGAGAAALAAAALGLVWGDAALWQRDTAQQTSTSVEAAGAPLGARAVRLERGQGATASATFQLVPPETTARLKGATVTLGAWVWASSPARLAGPQLYNYPSLNLARAVDAGLQPTFVAFTATLPATLTWPRVILAAPAAPAGPLTVYFDGIVMAEGERPLAAPPEFAEADGSRGTWGGKPFTNLLRNGSAERQWPALHPRLQAAVDRVFDLGVPASMLLGAPLDWEGTGAYFRGTASNLVKTFWGKFGWGHVPLLDEGWYSILIAITAAGVIGAGLALVRRRGRLPGDAMVVAGVALAMVWGMAMLRGLHTLIWQSFIPGARYAYPAVVPTLLALTAGWWELAELVRRPLRIPRQVAVAAFVAAFCALDVYALASLVTFYAGRVP